VRGRRYNYLIEINGPYPGYEFSIKAVHIAKRRWAVIDGCYAVGVGIKAFFALSENEEKRKQDYKLLGRIGRSIPNHALSSLEGLSCENAWALTRATLTCFADPRWLRFCLEPCLDEFQEASHWEWQDIEEHPLTPTAIW
jgi:hypothetical protein